MLKQVLTNGMPPSEVASLVLDAATTGRFYVLTHPEYCAIVDLRAAELRAAFSDRNSGEDVSFLGGGVLALGRGAQPT
jgi:hypothetical protein